MHLGALRRASTCVMKTARGRQRAVEVGADLAHLGSSPWYFAAHRRQMGLRHYLLWILAVVVAPGVLCFI